MQIKLNFQIFIFAIIFYFTKQIEIYVYILALGLMHELAHIVTGVILGLKPKTLQITPFGFSVYFEEYKKNGKKIFTRQKNIIVLAGPVFNILLAVAAIFINFDYILNISREIFIYANILLAVFNLLPIYPLDGGRIIKNILNGRGNLEPERKIYLSEQTGYITLVILTVITSILILYIKNVALFFIIICLWVIMIREIKYNKIRRRVCKELKKVPRDGAL
ncbi:MAG: site-2 protease family protein [Oscillospiraceae bacterium]|nr:site-2 protease family protein [Oscillospiraceae bacterium]